MSESVKSAAITNSLLLLWLGSVGCGTALSFVAGGVNVLRVVAKHLNDGEIEGGKAFAIGVPLLFATVIGFAGLLVAMIGLVCSLRRDRRHLFSAPHWIAFFSIALPAALAFMLR